MNKRILSLVLMIALCVAMMPAAAFGLSETETSVNVATLAELQAAINEYQQLCDDFEAAHQNDPDAWIGWIAEFVLTDDINIPADTKLSTMGIIVVPEGKTLTIESGEVSNLGIRNSGTVLVKSGGELQTTMGGETAILNYGTISVEEGAVLQSMFGGSVNNQSGATLTIDGDFFCRGFTDDQSGDTTPWFRNAGTVEGSGTVYACQEPFVNQSALYDLLTDALAGTGLTVKEQGSYFVSSYDELQAAIDDYQQQCKAFEDAHQEDPDAWIGWVAQFHMEDDIEIPEGAEPDTTGNIIVPSGKTLTISRGAEATLGLEIYGEVIVKSGAFLGTTMGGETAITNYGTLTVEKAAVLQSQMGGHVYNKPQGELKLDGIFVCNGYHDSDENSPNYGQNVLWFDNYGAVSGEGRMVIMPVICFGGSDTPAMRADMASKARAFLGNSSIPVYVFAGSFEELAALNAEAAVEGLFAGCDPEDPGDGQPMMRITDDLSLSKALWVEDGMDLVIENGKTLSIPGFDKLIFGRRGRIVVEAAGAASPDALAGGTLTVGGSKLLSGTDAEAVIRPTEDISWLSAGSYFPDEEYPKKALWLYLLQDAEGSGSIPESSALDPQLNLIVDDECVLTVTGTMTAPYVEVRGTVVNGENLTAGGAMYYNRSVGRIVVTGRTIYEVAFDLNHDDRWYGMGLEDESANRFYFDDNEVDYEPVWDGHTFSGWKIISGWDEVTEEQLAAFEIKEDGGRYYVDEPTEFPIIVQAQWDQAPEEPQEPEKVTISFVNYDGTVLQTSQELIGSMPAFSGETPEKPADSSYTYSFTGWEPQLAEASVDTTYTAVFSSEAVQQQGDSGSSGDSGDSGSSSGSSGSGDSGSSGSSSSGSSGSGSSTAEPPQETSPAAVETTAGAITLPPAVDLDSVEIPFTDVEDENAFYYEPVKWAYALGITDGKTEDSFAPEDECTRAQMMTFLWRAAGCPEIEADSSFGDVPENSYYYKAVLWAASLGITDGTSEGKFSPDSIINRGQMATFLYRFAQASKLLNTELTEEQKAAVPFTDLTEGAYYETAVMWAFINEISDGTTATTFRPDAPCVRGQIVTFLFRALAQ